MSGSCNVRVHGQRNGLGFPLPCASIRQVSSDASVEESLLAAIGPSLRGVGIAMALSCTEPARFIFLLSISQSREWGQRCGCSASLQCLPYTLWVT